MQCDLCEFNSQVRQQLVHHLESHLDLKCTVCQANFRTRFYLKLHLRRHFEIFICDKCGFKFNTHIQLDLHYKHHYPKSAEKALKAKPKEDEGTGEFQCTFCPRVFAKKSTLSAHRYRVHIRHINSNDFECKICSKKFYFREDFRQHGFEHYNKGKIVTCDFPDCKQFFKNRKALTVHKKSHNEPAYKCQHCEMVNFL